MNYPLRVLFVSRHNAARSQIAEALLRRIGGQDFMVASAGTECGVLDPLAQRVLADAGVDISGQLSKPIETYFGQEFDYVITLCDRSRENLPDFPGDWRHVHWDFPDPTEADSDPASRLTDMKHLLTELAIRLRGWVEMEHHRLAAAGLVAHDQRPAVV
ncbi:arsenate reductase ArsC [Plasticicumulans acidivorans]|uniref:Arsenate reductase n=1 Tax=Plasticicumulans acidivorans TaxID=886464 RepID=A0A317MPX2_9GAMM|nr:arsenate reductase ArsC [Plasticicumulans acidivorans]PWV58503.1 arsenate reductase [Plasticicumulans acidivorans]